MLLWRLRQRSDGRCFRPTRQARIDQHACRKLCRLIDRKERAQTGERRFARKYVVELAHFIEHVTGDVVQWIRLEGPISELFDMTVIPGVRKPTATGFLTDDIHSMITIETP